MPDLFMKLAWDALTHNNPTPYMLYVRYTSAALVLKLKQRVSWDTSACAVVAAAHWGMLPPGLLTAKAIHRLITVVFEATILRQGA